MKQVSLWLLLVMTAINTIAQPAEKDLKKVIELAIPVKGGANGACVVWHPVQKKYYAAMAGNVDFCLSVYTSQGKLVSPTTQKTNFDVRGLWYNPSRKSIQMNGYNEFGWAEYVLNSSGLPISVKKIFEGSEHQTSEQSVGAYDPSKKYVYFLNSEGNVEIYEVENGTYLENIKIKLGAASENELADNSTSEFEESYNTTTVIFTDIRGAELGLLNKAKKQIELYNAATGYLTRVWHLPEEAPAEDWLNFSFTNGICFLFDKEARIWYGYK